jgi:hypothetical protein
MSLIDDGIVISPKKLQLSNGAVSAQIPNSLLDSYLHTFSLSLTRNRLPLPFSVDITGLRVEPGAIVAAGTTHDVVLGGATLNQ